MLVLMSTAVRRIGRVLTLLACLAVVPAVCLASREVPVYTVDVAAQTPAALAQAMRAVLVRATGHARAANDPQLATLVSQATQYVQGYQQGPAGELQVTFKAAAIEQSIRAAGRSLWSADRPFTLIVLNPAPPLALQAADFAAVQQSAQTRGLPISIVPLAVRAANGQLLPSTALLAMVHNLGAEQLLIGEDLSTAASLTTAPTAPTGATVSPAPPAAASTAGADTPANAAPPDTWRWTLVTPFMTRQFTGSITTGIDATVRLLAPALQATPGDGIVETPVRIEGLATLDDYARVETMLAAVPGVHHSTVARVSGTAVVFDLWARGGAGTVSRMLASSPRFTPQTAAGMLTYRYVPPPPLPAPPPASAAAPQAAGSTAAPSTPATSAAAPPP